MATRSIPSELRFFERKELFARKLKKIAYVSSSRKSTWRSATLSELCFFVLFLKARNAYVARKIKEDCIRFIPKTNEEGMYLHINCSESQHGDHPLFESKERLSSSEIKEDFVRLIPRRNEERMYSNIYCPGRSSTWRSTPLELRFFIESKKCLRSSEIKEDCSQGK